MQSVIIPQTYFYLLCIFLFSLCFPVSILSFLPIVQRALLTNLRRQIRVRSKDEIACWFITKNGSQVHANTSGKTQYVYREQTPADFYLFYSKMPGSHDSSRDNTPEVIRCPELIPGLGTMTTLATFLCTETSTATNFDNPITHCCNLAC